MESAKKNVDYAPHHLEAQKKLKEAHELLKRNRFIEATTAIDEAVAALRMMRAAVRSYVE